MISYKDKDKVSHRTRSIRLLIKVILLQNLVCLF